MNTRRAAIYAQSESPEQQMNGVSSIEYQLDACLRYCEEQHYFVAPEHIYHEVTAETNLFHREAYMRLWQAVQNREVDVVIVFDFLRFSAVKATQFFALYTFEGCEVGIEYLSKDGYCIDEEDYVFLEMRYVFLAQEAYEPRETPGETREKQGSFREELLAGLRRTYARLLRESKEPMTPAKRESVYGRLEAIRKFWGHERPLDRVE